MPHAKHIPYAGHVLARDINRHHEACRAADGEAMGHALRAGELLLEAKAQVPHGGWAPWVAEHCRCSMRTAQLYMQLWRWARANPQRVAHLRFSEARALLAARQEGPPYRVTPTPPPPFTLAFGRSIDRELFLRLLRRKGGRVSDPLPTLVAALALLPDAPGARGAEAEGAVEEPRVGGAQYVLPSDHWCGWEPMWSLPIGRAARFPVIARLEDTR